MNYPRFIFFFLLFSLISRFGFSQLKTPGDFARFNHRRADSLKRLIVNAPDDSLKVWRLLDISNLEADSAEVSINYAYTALSLSEKLKYGPGIAASYSAVGSSNQVMRD